MKLSSAIAGFTYGLFLLANTASAAATVVKSTEVKVGSNIIDDISAIELEKLPIAISLELSTEPAQVSIVLSAEGKEILFPAVKKNSKYEVFLPVSKIPKFFKAQKSVGLELITGDFNKELNSVQKLFDLKISENLRNKTQYTPSLRYGALPEIHHIFKGQQTLVNPIIPIVFIGLVIVLLAGLISYWASLGLKFSSLSTVDFIFGATLIAYELVFVRYYINDSIFLTLARVGVLTPISVYSGSRVLRKVKARRSVGEKKSL